MNLWSLLNIWSVEDKINIICDASGEYIYEGCVRDIRDNADMSRYFNSIVTFAGISGDLILICIAH